MGWANNDGALVMVMVIGWEDDDGNDGNGDRWVCWGLQRGGWSNKPKPTLAQDAVFRFSDTHNPPFFKHPVLLANEMHTRQILTDHKITLIILLLFLIIKDITVLADTI